jgi:hypothetical protein
MTDDRPRESKLKRIERAARKAERAFSAWYHADEWSPGSEKPSTEPAAFERLMAAMRDLRKALT